MKNVYRKIAIAFVGMAAIQVSALDSRNRITTRVYLDATGNDANARVSTQYFDGLGRERMSVACQAGGDDNDLAVRTDYDARGNVGRKWLPVVGGMNLLKASAFNTAVRDQFGVSEIPYTAYHYEELGLNRQTGQDGPGRLWSGHGTKIEWFANAETGDYSCVILIASADGTIKASGVYKPQTLRVTQSTDGDGMKTIVFQNRSGQTVLQRRIGSDGLVADTRYIYDARGDLRCVLSPEGSRSLPTSGTINANTIERYGQRFDYDIWHRCISAKAPGCGAVEYVYNKMDAVCMESSAEQRARGEWTVSKYDRRGRLALRGIAKIPGATRSNLQTLYGDSLMQVTFVPDINKAEGSLMYTGSAGPGSFSPYMAWYYDNYDFIVGANAAAKSSYTTSATDGYTQQSLCTGTAKLMNGTGELWLSAVKYNHRGQPVLTGLWDLYLQSERLTASYKYDFIGNETERTETRETVSEGYVMSSHSVTTQTAYDRQGRPTQSSISVDGGAPVVLSQKEYDAYGRLKNDRGAVTVDYTYDIRSNLTEINSDIFFQTAWYGQTPTPGADVRYGGINALATGWSDGQDASGTYTHTETFKYNGLGRYVASRTADGMISEEVEVDLDANVYGVKRKYNGDVVQDAVMVMDGGKVTDVHDNSTPYWSAEVGRFSSGSYELFHDNDGRLTADGTRDIVSITYHTFGNLPRQIKMSNGDYTSNDYFPDGTLRRRQFSTRKVETIIKVNAAGDTIVKTRDRSQTATHTYSGSFEKTPDGLIYHTAEGHYDFADGNHYWHLRDRMGSTVAVVDHNAKIVQTTGYYPSGTPYRVPASGIQTPVDSKTDELHIGNKWLGHSGMNMYDNTARMHDPLLMRFASPDPLYTKFGDFSPWSHCAADPLNHFDPDGQEVKLYFTNLPDASWLFDFATHSFISVKDDKNQDIFSFGSEYDGIIGAFGGKLERRFYAQDKAVANGQLQHKVKGEFVIPPPDGMTSEEFDARVRFEAKKFAKETKQQYFFYPSNLSEGNCNTSTSTILLRAGVPKELIDKIAKTVKINYAIGFSSEDREITKQKIDEETENSVNFHFLIRIFE